MNWEVFESPSFLLGIWQCLPRRNLLIWHALHLTWSRTEYSQNSFESFPPPPTFQWFFRFLFLVFPIFPCKFYVWFSESLYFRRSKMKLERGRKKSCYYTVRLTKPANKQKWLCIYKMDTQWKKLNYLKTLN